MRPTFSLILSLNWFKRKRWFLRGISLCDISLHFLEGSHNDRNSFVDERTSCPQNLLYKNVNVIRNYMFLPVNFLFVLLYIIVTTNPVKFLIINVIKLLILCTFVFHLPYFKKKWFIKHRSIQWNSAKCWAII